jgi:hypothetical protein
LQYLYGAFALAIAVGAYVRYSYAVGGSDYVGDKTTLPWSATGSKKSAEKARARIPDETDVLYDPADPKTSCLYPPGRLSGAIYAIGGVVVLLLALAYVA